jgi:UDP-N-acetylglucosamine--N-acetylmuramyl-(pentapeptide) pyrophosphoryl-undecaprenol N-acetylglucosamine transferase
VSKGSYKFIFAGGGTGGHLYPAVAVAEQVKVICPEAKILFVGTKKKIESRIVPQLGYNFQSIWVSGLQRKFALKNLLFPIKLVVSVIQSIIINMRFKPSVAVGAGAYVSGPVVWIASLFGAKIVLLEQNSFPGATNRILEGKADSIHISFEDSQKYFKNESKLKLTGNPVRSTLELINRAEALKGFSLDDNKKVLLIIGGSLGAKSLNKAVAENIDRLVQDNIQIIWQTGEYYFDEYKKLENEYVKVLPFITDMSKAYSSCDLVVARAGATTIAEVSYLGLPVIFVPSTNVAANHQYKNALSLIDNDAGILIEDKEALSKLGEFVTSTINNKKLLGTLGDNIQKFSKPNAAKEIALDVFNLAKTNEKNKSR